MLSVNYFTKKINYEDVKKKFQRRRIFVQRDLYANNQYNYLGSNPALWALLPIIREIMPKAKIIHIIRDGRSWIRSVYSRKINNEGYLKKNRHGHVWKFTTDAVNYDLYYGEWQNMNMIERLAWIWKTKNQLIVNTIKDDANSITIKYEDIFNRSTNNHGMSNLIDFISEDVSIELASNHANAFERKVNDTKKFLLPPYQYWTIEQKNSFEKIAGEFLRQMGYD